MRPKPLVLGLLLLLLGGGLGIFNFGYALPLKMGIRGSGGQAVPGSIVDMREEMSESRRSVNYFAVIAYTAADGQQYQIEDTYDMVPYMGLKADRDAVVRYLKSDPRTAFEIHSKQADMSNFIWYGFVSAGLVLPGILLVIVGFMKPEAEEPSPTYVRPDYSGRKPPRTPFA